MAFMTIKVSASDAKLEVAAILMKYQKAINTNEILDVAGAMLLNRTRERFLREVNPDNVPWLPSKAGLKRRLLGSTGTLFKTGTLFHSIQLHADGPNDRTISTDVPYARYHQNGKGAMLRKFFGFSMEDEIMYSKVVENMVMRQLMKVSKA